MKIKAIYYKDVGPLKEGRINLFDGWEDSIYQFVFCSGPNGVGKSTLLRAITVLWKYREYWLETQKEIPKHYRVFDSGSIAIIFDEVFEGSGEVGLVVGDAAWFENIRKESTTVTWIGETTQKVDTLNDLDYTFLIVDNDHIFFKWAELYKGTASNMEWVIGIETKESLLERLEISLVILKSNDSHYYCEVVEKLNTCLHNKEIIVQNTRVYVRLKHVPDKLFVVDTLSSGEQQMLVQVMLLAHWLIPGGIALIDDIGMNIHSSALPSFMALLESIAIDRQQQTILTSHRSHIWERYESMGNHIDLGE